MSSALNLNLEQCQKAFSPRVLSLSGVSLESLIPHPFDKPHQSSDGRKLSFMFDSMVFKFGEVSIEVIHETNLLNLFNPLLAHVTVAPYY